jgi:signal transduction histidine kinase
MLCIQTVEREWPGPRPPDGNTTGELGGRDASTEAPLIAVIDDNSDIVAAVTETLDQLGYRVISYRDASDALEVMQHGEVPSLIVLDLMMPRMDGWTFRLRQRQSEKLRDVPVIVMSASGSAQAQAIDADAYLRKPLRMEQLCSTIEQMLARAERRRLLAHSTELERLRALGFLAASVAHEINNPLTYISGNLDLALRDCQGMLHTSDLPRAVNALQTKLGNARIGTDHVAEIVSGLLVFARSEHDAEKTADLTRSIDGALRLARSYAAARARLVFRRVELPHVIGQEGRLAQVFLNLIMNSAQAIEPGAPESNSISISARSDAQIVTVEITDTGRGIPQQNLSRVFEAFFTTKPPGQGTGIGLSFCRDVVQQVGGSIEVLASSAKGTTIAVSLRVAASS